LDRIPKVIVNSDVQFTEHGTDTVAMVSLKNPTDIVAFFIRLRVVDSDGQDVLPIFWEDNMFSLMPGDSRSITATFQTKNLHGKNPSLVIEIWNGSGSDE